MEVVLSTTELEKLLEVLGSTTSAFSQVESVFRAAFQEDQHVRVALGLQFLRRDAGLLVSNSTNGGETINALWLLDIMRRTAASESIGTVKSVLYDFLFQLELLLRDDARKAESAKYRTTTKEGGAGGTQAKRTATDVAEAEGMRCRNAAKLFGLECLAGKVPASATALTLLAADQATIDNALDGWQKHSTDIKETMNDLAHAAEMDSDRCSLGALNRLGVAASHGPSGTVFLSPSLARGPLPMVTTEVRSLLSNAALPQHLLFDGQWHSQAWRTAKELLQVAAATPLTPNQQLSATQSLTAATIPRLGINAHLICSIVAHNPEVAAAVLNKSKDSSSLLEAVLSSAAPADHIETVLLHSVKALRQIHVYKYIAASVPRVRGATGTTAKDLMTNLASTLHQLIIKFSKENKELYINDTQKAELAKLVEEHSGLPEVVSRWDELK